MRKDARTAMSVPTPAGAAPPFRAVCSVPSSPLRWVAIAGLVLFSGFSVALLLGMAYLGFVEDEEPAFVAAMMLIALVLLGISVFAWRYRRYSQIAVDEKGITYRNVGTDTVYREFSWRDLQANPVAGGYDVERITVSGHVNGSRISSDLFQWWIRGGKPTRHHENFRGAHPFYYFFSNRHELMAAFLHGVAQFRPDLTVDPRLFTTFHICPRRFRYDADSHFETNLAATIGAVFLAGLIAVITMILMNRHDAL